jgi:hypothetical protein
MTYPRLTTVKMNKEEVIVISNRQQATEVLFQEEDELELRDGIDRKTKQGDASFRRWVRYGAGL